MTAPRTPIVEAKVRTAAAAAAVVGLVLSLLSLYVFDGGPIPEALEVIVNSVVYTLVTGGITFLVGWLTRHTPRDVLDIHTEE